MQRPYRQYAHHISYHNTGAWLHSLLDLQCKLEYGLDKDEQQHTPSKGPRENDLRHLAVTPAAVQNPQPLAFFILPPAKGQDAPNWSSASQPDQVHDVISPLLVTPANSASTSSQYLYQSSYCTICTAQPSLLRFCERSPGLYVGPGL